MSAILVDGVKPTLAELERFEEQPEGKQFSYVQQRDLLNHYVHFRC